MSQRTDVKYSNRKIAVNNASWIGHDVDHVKPGYWVSFRNVGNDHIHTGRAVCVVDTLPDSPDKLVGWIVVAVMNPTCDIAMERWVDPDWIIRSTPHVPARMLEFMMSDFSDRATVIKRMDNGFPTGFDHYYTEPPKPDPLWEPAKQIKV